MSEIKWIKITTDIFDDEKICLIDALPDSDTILVIWFKILTLAGKHNSNGLLMMTDKVHYTDEMLATIFRRPLNTVRMAIGIFEQFGMIEIVDGVITLPNWEKHQNVDGMEKIKEQTRTRVAKYRKKQKNLALGNVTCNVTVTDGNALEEEQEKEEEKEEETSSSNSSSASSEKGIYEKFEEEFQKKLTPSEMKNVDRLVFAYGKDMVEKALDESILKGKASLGYITGILKNWSLSKVTTLGDRLAEKDAQQVNAIKRPSLHKASKGFKPSCGGKSKWGF